MPTIGRGYEKNYMKNILVLCTGNSCRSQIAEGYFRYFAGHRANIYSAGIQTHGVNPKAIQVMEEDSIDISGHTSNNVEEYTGIPFDYVITVCDNANENCPYLPGSFKRFHHNFPDPAKATGTPDEVMNAFRHVRNMIKDYSRDWIAKNLG
jgi:arsenate reductase